MPPAIFRQQPTDEHTDRRSVLQRTACLLVEVFRLIQYGIIDPDHIQRRLLKTTVPKERDRGHPQSRTPRGEYPSFSTSRRRCALDPADDHIPESGTC
jgi:hypothetical protein